MNNNPHPIPNPHPHPQPNRSKRGHTNIASCIVASTFLIFLTLAAVAVYFLLFKPKPPKIAVDAVQFPTFSVTNSTVNFTFFQFVTVTNPNRDAFTHFDSSLQLTYAGTPVGVIFIPAGKIDAGRTQHMSAKFALQSYPLPPVGGVARDEVGVGPTMEIGSRMKLVGRVRVLWVFTHKVESGVRCSVAIRVADGTVLGLRC